MSKSCRAHRRREVVIPALGLFMLSSITQFTGGQLGPVCQALVYGLAIVYAGIVLISPMKLPAKDPDLLDEHALRHVGGVLVMAVLSMMVGMSSEGESSTLGMLVTLPPSASCRSICSLSCAARATDSPILRNDCRSY